MLESEWHNLLNKLSGRLTSHLKQFNSIIRLTELLQKVPQKVRETMRGQEAGLGPRHQLDIGLDSSLAGVRVCTCVKREVELGRTAYGLDCHSHSYWAAFPADLTSAKPSGRST